MNEEFSGRLKNLDDEFKLLRSRFQKAEAELFRLRSDYEKLKADADARAAAGIASGAMDEARAVGAPVFSAKEKFSRTDNLAESRENVMSPDQQVEAAVSPVVPPPLPAQKAAVEDKSAVIRSEKISGRAGERLQGDEAEDEVTRNSFEMRFGMVWAVRLGVLALLTGLVFLSSYTYQNVIQFWPNWSKAAMLYAVSFSLLGIGFWLEKGRESLRNFSRVLMGGGMGAVYYVTFASHHVAALRWIESATLCGALLVGLAGAMVWFADRRKSAILGTAAVALAYYSVMIGQAGWAAPLAHLVLGGAAVALMLRNKWQVMPYIALVGTYLGYAVWQGQIYEQHSAWHLSYLAGYWLLFLFAALAPAVGRLSGSQRSLLIVANTIAALFLAAWSGADRFDGVMWVALLSAGVVCSALVPVVARLQRSIQTERTLLTLAVVLSVTGLCIQLSGSVLLLVLGVVTLLLRYGAKFSRYGWLLGMLSVLSGLLGVVASFFALGYTMGANSDFAVRVVLGALFLAGACYRLPFENYRIQVGSLAMGLFSVIMFVAAGVLHLTQEVAVVSWAVLGSVFLALGHKRGVYELILPAVVLLCVSLLGSVPFDFASVNRWNFWSIGIFSAVWIFHMLYWRADGQGKFSENVRQWMSNTSAIVFVFWSFIQLGAHDVIDDWAIAGPIMALAILVIGGLLRHGVFALGGQLFAFVGLVHFLMQGNLEGLIFSGASFLIMAPAAAWCASRLGGKLESQLVGALRYAPVVVALQLIYYAFEKAEANYLPTLLAIGAAIFAGTCIWRKGPVRATLAVVYGILSFLSYLTMAFTSNAQTPIHLIAWLALLLAPYLLKIAGVFGPSKAVLLPLWSTAQIGMILWLVAWREDFSLTLMWAVWGFLMMVLGIATKERCQRLWGLGMLLLALGHVCFIDAWQLGTLERIFAFIGLGILLIGLGFIYNRFQEQIKKLF